MKAKKPIQILLLDDNGREVFSAYVGDGHNENCFDIAKPKPLAELGEAMEKAIAAPLEKDAAKRFAN